jgi:hypothetical protein
MPKLKLTYFDIHGGRGEPARLALSIGGIPFEDDRLAPSDWQRRKPDRPFGACQCSKWMDRHSPNRMPSIATPPIPPFYEPAALAEIEQRNAIRAHNHLPLLDVEQEIARLKEHYEDSGHRSTTLLTFCALQHK